MKTYGINHRQTGAGIWPTRSESATGGPAGRRSLHFSDLHHQRLHRRALRLLRPGAGTDGLEPKGPSRRAGRQGGQGEVFGNPPLRCCGVNKWWNGGCSMASFWMSWGDVFLRIDAMHFLRQDFRSTHHPRFLLVQRSANEWHLELQSFPKREAAL